MQLAKAGSAQISWGHTLMIPWFRLSSLTSSSSSLLPYPTRADIAAVCATLKIGSFPIIETAEVLGYYYGKAQMARMGD